MRRKFPDADFVPANYGEPPPDMTGRDVYIVDFSYPRPVMDAITASAKSVVVLDHHKTAQAALAGLEAPNAEIVFDMGCSGGRLTWEYINRDGDVGKEPPWLVDYTEDRDLWLWRLPRSKEINAALRSYPMTFDMWDYLGRTDHTRLIPEGEAILRAQQQVVDSHVGFAREIDFSGHKVLCVNATVYTSEIGGELANDRPFGMTWFRRADGQYIISLRSRDGGIDVSEVAKSMGGGGHRNAAGCQLNHPPGDQP